MAGDIDIDELVIVGSADAPDVRRIAAEVGDRRGAVTHQYGRRLFVASITPENARTIARRHGAVVIDSSEIADDLSYDLDEAEALGLSAFRHRQSREFAAAKSRRPLDGLAWDSSDGEPPDYFDAESSSSADASSVAAAAGPTSSRLTGSVAVGLVIVTGVRADLDFTAAERIKVVAEVQNGLSWLGGQGSPGGISWNYDLRVITLDVEPSPSDVTLDEREARWRDPTLAQLGFDPGHGGVWAYVQQLRSTLNTDWAYCAFFTKYPLGWFAYAHIGGPKSVMQYANDGWGPDNIDRVFAHETGHIFGAPDEYGSSGCNCGGAWGLCRKPNGNCANCAAGGAVPCIMKVNTWEMCGYTPYHLGFDLQTTVPLVREMRQEHAAQAVREVCLVPKFTGTGGVGAWVQSQSPGSGTLLPRGATVTMQLRTGPIP